jgi:heme/copper-type cytochrome/quinol oxidase subunit 2
VGARARYLAGCAAVIGWSLAMVMPVFAPVPMLWYYPLDHAFELSARAHGFATSWYGRTVLALLGGVVGFVLGTMTVRVTRARSQRAMTVGTLWAAVAVVLALSVYAYQLAHRVPELMKTPDASAMTACTCTERWKAGHPENVDMARPRTPQSTANRLPDKGASASCAGVMVSRAVVT